jgi:hypothetical protein
MHIGKSHHGFNHSPGLIVASSVAPAIASNYSRAGVVVNFVTATGGDVEMLRSIECFYKLGRSSCLNMADTDFFSLGSNA